MLVRPLSAELDQKAAVELNETPKKLEDGINHLKDWINKQPHLRARTDDQWLAAFLRGCKHSLERAKEKLDLYYSLRTLSPDLFAFRPNTPRFKELVETGAGLVLPKLASPLDPRVVIVKPSLYDPNRFTPIEFFSFAHILQQIKYLEDDAFMVNGMINVIDLEGITMAHFLQLTPSVLKKLVIAGQDASPLRLKSLHIINSIPAFEKVFNMVVKLLNEKHQKKVHMYSKDFTVLQKYVPLEILPEEYGGQGGSREKIIDFWLKKIDSYSDWFDEDLKFGTDESKRPGKPKSAEQMFGVEGSFRKLDVD
ncbi:alpha-tocopherol transfer protein-like [Helicoverpa zea]|uniref:alpha-tocopherol transfer protein-like n=1 Tax=Helicoverpa zea TaxID=7113 RepID=UPI001F59E7B7|nr:alpha-tocopherol transfer protein-like [Helicoverpa zea]